MVLRNSDNVPVSFVFSSSKPANNIYKIHAFLLFSHNIEVGFFHTSFSTPINSIHRSLMILQGFSYEDIKFH